MDILKHGWTPVDILTIILSHGEPHQRFEAPEQVLDLLLHGGRWPAVKKIHKANGPEKSVGNLS
jgi:hypothetical protein